MKTITLVNDFYNTMRKVKAGPISRATARRVRRVLCGVEGCTCGDGLGQRDAAIGGHVEVSYHDGVKVFEAVTE